MLSVWRPAYIALGSNLHDPPQRIAEAFERLADVVATRLEARSRSYLARPMGPQDQPEFVNAAAGLVTQLTAQDLLHELLGIERAMGRDRGERWGPRIVDLDLIWMPGPCIDEPALTLPHPGVSVRNFVLYPLCDIAPTLVIPGRGSVFDLKSRIGGDGLSVMESLA